MVGLNMPVMFLLPAMYVAGKYRPGQFRQLTRIDRRPTMLILFFVLITILISQPGLNLLGEWNKSFNLPDSFRGLMEWIQRTEYDAEALSKLMIETSSIWALMANLVVMAVLPGLCEEFLFRGVVQPFFFDWFGRKHLAIWTTAFIFSFIHFQFFGFIPRLLLGAMLGYVVMYSGSLWSGVLMHTINNAFVVLISYLQFNHHLSTQIDSMGTANTSWIGYLSLAFTFAVFFVFINKSTTDVGDKNRM
jgi:membrane protease YdiL (CAAX protease family)